MYTSLFFLPLQVESLKMQQSLVILRPKPMTVIRHIARTKYRATAGQVYPNVTAVDREVQRVRNNSTLRRPKPTAVHNAENNGVGTGGRGRLRGPT